MRTQRGARVTLTTVAALAVVALLFAACTGDEATPTATSATTVTATPTTTSTVTPTATPTPQLVEYEQARARWDALDTEDYLFFLQRRCECPAEWSARTMVIVRNGAVTSASIDGSPAPDGAGLTIDELFDEIERALEESVRIEVTYHSELGHPLDVQLDLDAIAVDGGLSLVVSDFDRLR